jgi:hypothetical protein
VAELANEERETMLNMTADNRGVWLCFSDDPVMMKKLEEVGEFVRVVGQGKEYRLRADQITIRKGKRAMSDERRAQLATHMRGVRKYQVITSPEVANRAS